MDFNWKHGKHITRDTVAKLINDSKRLVVFQTNLAVVYTVEGTSDMVLATSVVSRSPPRRNQAMQLQPTAEQCRVNEWKAISSTCNTSLPMLTSSA
ncbi:hypothetical protein Q7C36_018519 [Tachysurus vachellii]|uniref:Uncharacterized protein n=1 Tax=Tachysurus vachellii TaxID=175792 RepID=A0AA88SAV2_TACVA|nr:hypothetical protein Q7C36_018519 [Tachysurus vachellii]